MYKLICGDLIVCTEPENYTDSTPECILKKPLQLIMGPGPEGKIQMVLIPWMSQDPKIKKSAIIGECVAPSPVVQEYIKLTTNIQLIN